MKKGDLLFVYGTLMAGERMSLPEIAGFSVSSIGIDQINGQIYNLGSFPGVKLPEPNVDDGLDLSALFDPTAPVVSGEVYRIMVPGLVARLDAYEGYPNLYNRREVVTAHGRTVWVYFYNDACREGDLIASGDWRTRVGQQMAA